MRKGNVLVIGNSGVGKSTLINAVLGKDVAPTGWGNSGFTGKLEIYKSENTPFNVIDTIGFEPSFIKKHKAINAVKKWSKESAKSDNSNKINVIWFCIDGTSRKLFPEAIKNLSSAVSMWKTVPIIVVITKSYSEMEREENIQMVNNAFEKQKISKNLYKIIPVVASTFSLHEGAFASPFGISELIDATNNIMPQGIKAAENDIKTFKLNRKRALSQGVISTCTAGGVAIGAIPIPVPDNIPLSTLEFEEINSLAMIWGINKNEKSKRLFNSIVNIGTVGAAAKAAITGLKAIPGINIGAAVLNAVIAGFFVFCIGEGSSYAFEQIYLGNKSIDDIDWVNTIIENALSSKSLEKAKTVLQYISDNNIVDKNKIAELILNIFTKDK